MGNANSAFTVVNAARYEITVELFSPKDVGGEFAKRRLTVLPGEQCKIPTTKKGTQLRISGNGRVQDLQRAVPGEVITVRKVQRSFAAMQEDAERAQSAEPEQQERQPIEAKKAEEQFSKDKKRVREWLDDKGKYSKDELQQLMVKLNKESRTEQRAKLLKQIRRKEAESKAREEAEDVNDELSASIAALRQRNDKRGFSSSHMQQPPNSRDSSEEEGEGPAAPFSVNTDTKTDDLMAAINRLTVGGSRGHAKKNSWERAPQFFAQI